MDITIRLAMEQWNQVLDILSEASVKRALPLINAIMAQAKEQMPANEQPTNGVSPLKED